MNFSSPAKRLSLFFQSFFLEIVYAISWRNYTRDRSYLKSIFRHYYPNLVKSYEGDTICIGCDLCSEICPEESIKLDRTKMMNFPDSLKTGAVPTKIELDLLLCSQCGLCSKVCPVKALDLKGQFRGEKVDLLQVLD